MAKLILTNEVTGLGEPGDVVEVKDGYARNYLLPRNLATPWTKGYEKQIDSIRKARKAREVATVDDAKALATTLAAEPVVVTAKAGAAGKLFGAITTTDIAAAVSKKGVSVDKRKIEIKEPIKVTGDHQVSVRLHPEVTAKVKVSVVAL
jgi:large subunit ribosomal protein L9